MVSGAFNALIIFSLVFFYLFGSVAFAQQPDPDIRTVVTKVNIDTISKYIKELSGEIETLIDGEPYRITSRNKYDAGNEMAAIYLKQKLESFGLHTREQVISPTCSNIYAEQTGSVFPDEIYIICAHYDSRPEGSVSPGADDNASGVAAVLEAARILSKYKIRHTILYALWDEEEYDFMGSINYARNAAENGEMILGVVNLDMIGWDENYDGNVDIIVDTSAYSTGLAQAAVQVNDIYNTDLFPTIYEINAASDQWSFWYNGYIAILIMENHAGGDFNDYYHSLYDLFEHLNQPYLHNVSRLSIATLVSLAGIDTSSVDSSQTENINYTLYQNYPNPFSKSTVISYSIKKPAMVTLKVYDLLGREVHTLVSAMQGEQEYSVEFDASRLSSGLYYVRIQAGNEFTDTRNMLVLH